MAVKASKLQVFWVVTRCNVMLGYVCFRGPFCLNFQGSMDL